MANTEKILLLNINNKYRDLDNGDLYKITRRRWCVDLNNVKDIKLVCAVVKGKIIEVFKIHNWNVCKHDPKRKEFEGELAPNEIRINLIEKSVKEYWKKGSQNPVKYAKLNKILGDK